jgi:hypothetical protein
MTRYSPLNFVSYYIAVTTVKLDKTTKSMSFPYLRSQRSNSYTKSYAPTYLFMNTNF